MKCKNVNCKEKNLIEKYFRKHSDGNFKKECIVCENEKAKLKAREKAAERNKYNFA